MNFDDYTNHLPYDRKDKGVRDAYRAENQRLRSEFEKDVLAELGIRQLPQSLNDATCTARFTARPSKWRSSSKTTDPTKDQTIVGTPKPGVPTIASGDFPLTTAQTVVWRRRPAANYHQTDGHPADVTLFLDVDGTIAPFGHDRPDTEWGAWAEHHLKGPPSWVASSWFSTDTNRALFGIGLPSSPSLPSQVTTQTRSESPTIGITTTGAPASRECS